MKTRFAFLLLVACFWPLMAPARTVENFDAGWLFSSSEFADAQMAGFDDSGWRKLDLPHDWSIAGPFAETNLTGGAGAFLPGGVVWYRKHFTLPPGDAGRQVAVEFDGVMQNSDVWINGTHLGHRPYGYVSFGYDLTTNLNLSGDNVLVVRCDTSDQPASRWYSGGGIYRHVHLVTVADIHIPRWGVFISTPQATSTQAMVKIRTTLTNGTDSPRKITVRTTLISPDGKLFATTELETNLAAALTGEVEQQVEFSDPQRWNLNDPKLYRATSQILCAGKILDEDTNAFGIRDAHFEAPTGFWLNGENIKIKGVCLHQDGGAFGAAVPLDVWQQRLTTLRQLGVNAIRTAHNPPSTEFLDLCDQMGFLVMDEFFDCWQVAKKPYDYHLFFDQWSQIDERDTILRDRNHPSIILYSVGNEIHDTPHPEKAKPILAGLVGVAHENDPTRPVTQALFRPNVSGDYTNGLADMLDVVGQNYRVNEILAAHEQNPSRKIIGTENIHDRESWVGLRDNAPYAGQFLWTGIDYLGESRKWPAIGFGSGLLDRTGKIRPAARERQSWWTAEPMVSVNRRVSRNDLMPTDPGYGGEERFTQVVFADWTPASLSPHNENVEVYSNCKEVELILNGKSLGAKTINADASPREWRVAYVPGTLKAVARDGRGKVVASDELRTADKPAKIMLSCDTRRLLAGFDHVAVVRATITDTKGIRIPRANELVSFSVSGPGEITAVDNGDNTSHEPFQATFRHAYGGECVAFVRATDRPGKIKLTASAEGLAGNSISLRATAR
jgi:beta-galactosidase